PRRRDRYRRLYRTAAHLFHHRRGRRHFIQLPLIHPLPPRRRHLHNRPPPPLGLLPPDPRIPPIPLSAALTREVLDCFCHDQTRSDVPRKEITSAATINQPGRIQRILALPQKMKAATVKVAAFNFESDQAYPATS